MRRSILTALVLISFHFVFAQTNGLDIPKDSSLIRGFYMSYQEYLNNAPSLKIDFTTKLFTIGKNDSIVIRAEYQIADSLELEGEIWGFCDGKNVFVQCNTFFEFKYWKLMCKGPNPYFFFKKKSVAIPFSPFGLLATAASLAIPANYDLMFVDDEGKSRYASKYYLKRLFGDDPVLFKAFKEEKNMTDSLATVYIVRYNYSKTVNTVPGSSSPSL